jgi:acyl-homoserine-lactone acylase
MKKLIFLVVLAGFIASCHAQNHAVEAARVTIVRDDRGIAHVYGKTDADAVFGMIYAQCEDDFNRVETNYLNAMGRLAEAEGEDKVYQDLRMKMFIDPENLKKEYAASPQWLRKLMDASGATSNEST